MLSVILGLSGALVFGAADFLGGLASRRISPVRVTGLAALAGLALLAGAQVFVGGEWSFEALLYGGLSGVTGAIAIVLLYGCLAIGPMSILSPLTALVSACIPLTWGLLRGERLSTLGMIAIGVALVAVVLVGLVREESASRPSVTGLLMAIGSGIMIGAFLILIDLAPDDSGLVPLIANRAVNATLILGAIAVLTVVAHRQRDRGGQPRGMLALGWRAGLWLAIGCGALDAVANTLLLVGLRVGELTIMSVLTALYPAGTIILAAFVLRERITAQQGIGLVLALAAAGMLALA